MDQNMDEETSMVVDELEDQAQQMSSRDCSNSTFAGGPPLKRKREMKEEFYRINADPVYDGSTLVPGYSNAPRRVKLMEISRLTEDVRSVVLKNSTILGLILSYLSNLELRRTALVARQWRLESYRTLRCRYGTAPFILYFQAELPMSDLSHYPISYDTHFDEEWIEGCGKTPPVDILINFSTDQALNICYMFEGVMTRSTRPVHIFHAAADEIFTTLPGLAGSFLKVNRNDGNFALSTLCIPHTDNLSLTTFAIPQSFSDLISDGTQPPLISHHRSIRDGMILANKVPLAILMLEFFDNPVAKHYASMYTNFNTGTCESNILSGIISATVGNVFCTDISSQCSLGSGLAFHGIPSVKIMTLAFQFNPVNFVGFRRIVYDYGNEVGMKFAIGVFRSMTHHSELNDLFLSIAPFIALRTHKSFAYQGCILQNGILCQSPPSMFLETTNDLDIALLLISYT